MPVTSRLERWIRKNFAPDVSVDVMASLDGLEQDLATERIQAAIVLPCTGRRDWFEARMELAKLDWRDVLMYTGLENTDWPKVLNRRLGRRGR